MNKVGWVYHPRFLDHRTGPNHPERPDRLRWIISELEGQGLMERLQALPVVAAHKGALTAIHDPAYVDLVEMMCREGMTFIGSPDTLICPESYEVALLAAGGVLSACAAIMAGTVDRAFCAVRPPGHHAERGQAMGFCLFNNVAVAAEYLVSHGQVERVAIVDWDVHHGNATQHLFENRSDVLFVSLHESPAVCFPHTGFPSETGHGAGEGYTLNIPLMSGQGDPDYRLLFEEQALPALDRFQPEVILISAGFDACREDGMARVNLEPESFGWMTRLISELSFRHSRGRILSVLEGGYHPVSLPRAVAWHVRGLFGELPG